MAPKQRKILNAVSFISFIFLNLCIVIFWEITSFVYSDDFPLVISHLRISLFLVWLILLVIIFVLYTKRENRFQDLFWRDPTTTKHKNKYLNRLLIGIILLILVPLFFYEIVPKISFMKVFLLLDITVPLTLLCIVGFLASTIVLYGYEQDRITQTAFIKLIRELGCNETVIDKLKFGKRKWSGIWAEVEINYKYKVFKFAGEDAGRPNGVGQFACFLLGLQKENKPKCTQEQLLTQMDDDTKQLFQQLQKQVKGLYLSCQKHNLFYRIPMTHNFNFQKNINVDFLRKAMDVILAIP